jgi:hypothetical protein
MSQGREGYVPGGYKLVGGWQDGETIVLKYENRKGERYRRIVNPQQKGWRHAVSLINWLERNYKLG